MLLHGNTLIEDNYQIRIWDSLSIDQRAKRWEETFSKPKKDTHVFVAEIDREIVGFCSVGPCRDNDMDKHTSELWAIYVDPKSMNKGIGSALHEHGLNYLRGSCYKKAILWVLTSNEKTRKWYEGRGWVVEGKTKIDQREDFQLHETRYVINL